MRVYKDKWKADKQCPLPPKGVIGWMHNYSAANYWRVSGYMELSDLNQEGWQTYSYVYNRYGRLPPKLFMALYQTAFKNRLHDLNRKIRLWKEYEVRDCDQAVSDDNVSPMDKLQSAELNSDLQGILMVIADAPSKEVRRVLSTFLTEGSALISKPIYRRVVMDRESPGQYVCRVLGFDPAVARDILRQTKEYLYGSMTTP